MIESDFMHHVRTCASSIDLLGVSVLADVLCHVQSLLNVKAERLIELANFCIREPDLEIDLSTTNRL